MTAHEALIIEDAYLHTEDAPGLDDVIVYVSDCTVDITTTHDNAISLSFEDFAAIQRKVDQARKVNDVAMVNATWPPDWSAIATGYDFAAVDSDGMAYAYRERPNQYSGWFDSADKVYLGNFVLPAGMWEQSLCIRPIDPGSLMEVTGISWADVPMAYNFVAVDRNGNVYAYQGGEPFPQSDQWWPRGTGFYERFTARITLPANLSWRNALFVRPGYTE